MNKSGKIFKFLLFLIIIILIISGGVIWYLNTLISNIEYKDIDENDLSVNTNLYEDVKEEIGINKSDFEKVYNIVLFGTDSRNPEQMEAGRADTIMIASVNTIKKSIKLISIPRDTYVDVPEYGYTKINHSYAYGKEQLAIKTINSNFGLDITDYATIDFSGLIHIINEIGGVTVEITEEEKNYINTKSKEAYDISGNEYQKVIEVGNVKLSGEQALTHSRNRTIGDDFTRAGRQRDVLQALINKITSLGIEDILTLSEDFLKEVRTNININEYIPALISIILEKDYYIENVISKQIPDISYSKSKMINGIYYFTTDYTLAKQELYKTLYEM